jgi:hypothetical protein
MNRKKSRWGKLLESELTVALCFKLSFCSAEAQIFINENETT